jgi:superfamily II DNA/RNA helicase
MHCALCYSLVLICLMLACRGLFRDIVKHRSPVQRYADRTVLRYMGNDATDFHSQGLPQMSSALTNCLASVGINQLTEVQRLAYPAISNGRDVIIGAETGSGKTLAYMLPLFDKLLKRPPIDSNNPAAVVMAPTKELCRQIYTMCNGISSELQAAGHSVRIGNVVVCTC